MSTVITATLQDILLDSLSDAIGLRRLEVDECGWCRKYPEGHCPEHERDYELAVLYEKAERQVRAAGEELLAMVSGQDGGEG